MTGSLQDNQIIIIIDNQMLKVSVLSLSCHFWKLSISSFLIHLGIEAIISTVKYIQLL